MDLGSMICTPREPLCTHCPLRNSCKGYLSNKPESYPLRSVKKKVPHIEAIAAVIQKDGKVLLRQRPPKGLLGGLWEFPNWPLDGKKDLKEYLKLKVKSDFGLSVKCKEPLGSFKQTYSHFKLTLHVYHCQVVDGIGKGKWIPIKNLSLLPFSSIHRKIANTIIPK
jgi:A/G-specific adenine glycosylase